MLRNLEGYREGAGGGVGYVCVRVCVGMEENQWLMQSMSDELDLDLDEGRSFASKQKMRINLAISIVYIRS